MYSFTSNFTLTCQYNFIKKMKLLLVTLSLIALGVGSPAPKYYLIETEDDENNILPEGTLKEGLPSPTTATAPDCFGDDAGGGGPISGLCNSWDEAGPSSSKLGRFQQAAVAVDSLPCPRIAK